MQCLYGIQRDRKKSNKQTGIGQKRTMQIRLPIKRQHTRSSRIYYGIRPEAGNTKTALSPKKETGPYKTANVQSPGNTR
jgi:hypothetical protein